MMSVRHSRPPSTSVTKQRRILHSFNQISAGFEPLSGRPAWQIWQGTHDPGVRLAAFAGCASPDFTACLK
jgi:hypothetical protein